MIIVCAGPDTLQARQKARELADAFRKKFDPQGLSMETLPSPDPKEILNRIGTPSLFAQKRYVRCDGLLAKAPIAQVRILAKRLAADGGSTILVVVEDEAPTKKVLDEFKDADLHVYSYPLRSALAHAIWCVARGKELGVAESRTRQIAEQTIGDPWRAEQELQKSGAFVHAHIAEHALDETSVFDVGDAFLGNTRAWRQRVDAVGADQLIPIVVKQSRQAIQVHDGETDGINPYVARKLHGLRMKDPGVKFLSILRALIGSRTSLGSARENVTQLQ